jgi:hypothetical protein
MKKILKKFNVFTVTYCLVINPVYAATCSDVTVQSSYEAEIVKNYEFKLGRQDVENTDPDGYGYWQGECSNYTSTGTDGVVSVNKDALKTNMMRAAIIDTYTSIWKREPGQGEVDHWLSLLTDPNGTTTIADLENAIKDHDNYKRNVGRDGLTDLAETTNSKADQKALLSNRSAMEYLSANIFLIEAFKKLKMMDSNVNYKDVKDLEIAQRAALVGFANEVTIAKATADVLKKVQDAKDAQTSGQDRAQIDSLVKVMVATEQQIDVLKQQAELYEILAGNYSQAEGEAITVVDKINSKYHSCRTSLEESFTLYRENESNIYSDDGRNLDYVHACRPIRMFKEAGLVNESEAGPNDDGVPEYYEPFKVSYTSYNNIFLRPFMGTFLDQQKGNYKSSLKQTKFIMKYPIYFENALQTMENIAQYVSLPMNENASTGAEVCELVDTCPAGVATDGVTCLGAHKKCIQSDQTISDSAATNENTSLSDFAAQIVAALQDYANTSTTSGDATDGDSTTAQVIPAYPSSQEFHDVTKYFLDDIVQDDHTQNDPAIDNVDGAPAPARLTKIWRAYRWIHAAKILGSKNEIIGGRVQWGPDWEDNAATDKLAAIDDEISKIDTVLSTWNANSDETSTEFTEALNHFINKGDFPQAKGNRITILTERKAKLQRLKDVYNNDCLPAIANSTPKNHEGYIKINGPDEDAHVDPNQRGSDPDGEGAINQCLGMKLEAKRTFAYVESFDDIKGDSPLKAMLSSGVLSSLDTATANDIINQSKAKYSGAAAYIEPRLSTPHYRKYLWAVMSEYAIELKEQALKGQEDVKKSLADLEDQIQKIILLNKDQLGEVERVQRLANSLNPARSGYAITSDFGESEIRAAANNNRTVVTKNNDTPAPPANVTPFQPNTNLATEYNTARNLVFGESNTNTTPVRLANSRGRCFGSCAIRAATAAKRMKQVKMFASKKAAKKGMSKPISLADVNKAIKNKTRAFSKALRSGASIRVSAIKPSESSSAPSAIKNSSFMKHSKNRGGGKFGNAGYTKSSLRPKNSGSYGAKRSSYSNKKSKGDNMAHFRNRGVTSSKFDARTNREAKKFDINTNKGSDLFKIISNRYTKTAMRYFYDKEL